MKRWWARQCAFRRVGVRVTLASWAVIGCGSAQDSGGGSGADVGVGIEADAGFDAGHADAEPVPGAAASYSVDSLNFELVLVSGEATLTIDVQSVGEEPYRISSFTSGDPDAFRIAVDPQLETGLAVGQSAPVRVTYRPCPEAWEGDQVRPGFDLSICPASLAAVNLTFMDNSADSPRQVSALGWPADPPQLSILCPPFTACGDANAPLRECTTMNFGQVKAATEPPCDLLLVLRNGRSGLRPPLPLLVRDVEIIVENIANGTEVSGAEGGFFLLDPDLERLEVTAANPVTVEVPREQQEADLRLWLRFTGTQPGLWRGSAPFDQGVRFTSNDPNQPTSAVSVVGAGSTGDIFVFPDFVNFEIVPVGTTVTATIAVRNDGDSPLSIQQFAFESATTELSWSTDRGQTLPIELATLESLELYIEYSPQDAGNDRNRLQIMSNDPDEPTVTVDILAGPQPRIEVDPSSLIRFRPQSPMAVVSEMVSVCNVGTADLVVSTLDIEPVLGSGTDDFSIASPACPSVPCTVNIRLCAPREPSCRTDCTSLTLESRNDDQSAFDEANLVITSNDLGNRTYRVGLRR